MAFPVRASGNGAGAVRALRHGACEVSAATPGTGLQPVPGRSHSVRPVVEYR